MTIITVMGCLHGTFQKERGHQARLTLLLQNQAVADFIQYIVLRREKKNTIPIRWREKPKWATEGNIK